MKDEIMQAINDLGYISIVLSDGDIVAIGDADNWLGGSDEGYMCDALGNVEYSSIENCVDALITYLFEKNITIAHWY